MAPAFQPRRVAAFAPAIVAATERWVGKQADDTAPIDMAQEMSGLTLEIISEIMFSAADDPAIAVIGASVDRYQKSVRPTIADLLGLPSWWPRPAIRRAAKLFIESDRAVTALIERRRAAPDAAEDLLSLLMAVPESGDPPLSPREIRDQVATVITAGHETTAKALCWTWYLLSLHPAVEARLHAELDAALDGRSPTHEDLTRLVYTRAVLEESMRLYPPAHTFSRCALRPDRLGNFDLPQGAEVLIVPWLLHRHRRLWRDPEVFDPERMSSEQTAARPRYAYIPFGAGPRICIGAHLAMTEAMLILATVAQRYRPRLVEGADIEPVGLITLRPRHGMPMRLNHR
jgi:cytochrome P450